ncbi:AAA family ATPase [Bradyrhizobium tunisiense]|uniref:AAA family ATPase n=1 Tax=Bradyrhizobium tunisiense TaxID=3278709 RepID=UPI0035DB1C1C
MLQEIKIAGCASYSNEGETLASLKKINFIFGSNGVGKTTISRLINDPHSYPSSALTWTRGRPLEPRVYNSDFVTRNFAAQLPGIFTLGEIASDTLDKINTVRGKVKELEDGIAQLKATLGPADASSGKQHELLMLRTHFEADCWKIKSKHDAHFKEAFTGVRNSQAKFCDKVLAELATNTSAAVALDELKRKAATLFEKGLERHAPIPLIEVSDLLAIEAQPVLAKKVVGKDDVDVATIIHRLGNSDWVRQGLHYLDHSSQCPFCQQEVEVELAARLNAYFDESYLKDMTAIAVTVETYEVVAEQTSKRLEDIISLQSRHLDTELLRADVDRFDARIEVNKRLLEAKKREPSTPMTLEPLAALAETIITKIAAANALIKNHNLLVDNLATERGALVCQTWKYLLDENNAAIRKYQAGKEALDKAVQGLTQGIAAKDSQLTTAKAELRELEKKITSVQPTVSAINALLASFGFSGFKLKTTGERDHLYEIVRHGGGNAAATLSEGEKSFVCFLYFYHLVHGSVSDSDLTADRIVVFDDPVSSLDSDVLFIVSTLIKRMLKEASEGAGQIKQAFLLTHNIYFHKEVSFDPNRGAESRTHETFWIVRKVDGVSRIVNYKYNPIKTSYELLWSEVRNPSRSNITIQNTLRRIIENYFKILGNVDTNEIIAKFEGKDQQVCASLFSWVNDGSHSAHDDLYVTVDDQVVARYLDVFQRIFEKTEHHGHYKMMMGSEEFASPTQSAVTTAIEAAV